MEAIPAIGDDDYIARERSAENKSEFLQGETFAMAGGSPRHNLVCVNCAGTLRSLLRGKPCVVLSSDQRVWVEGTGLYTYPDVTVVCGSVRSHPKYDDTIVNPTLLVEVLSPSTEAYDRGTKFAHYRRITTLKEYVLISVEERIVEIFERADEERWILSTYASPAISLRLASLAIEVPLGEIYENLEALATGPEPSRVPRRPKILR